MHFNIKVKGCPPSVNNYCRTALTPRKKIIRYVCPQALAYKRLVREKFNAKYPHHKILSCPLLVRITLGFKIPSKHDVDNFAKVPLDALSNVCYVDDKQITELLMKKVKASEDHCIIDIWQKRKEE